MHTQKPYNGLNILVLQKDRRLCDLIGNTFEEAGIARPTPQHQPKRSPHQKDGTYEESRDYKNIHFAGEWDIAQAKIEQLKDSNLVVIADTNIVGNRSNPGHVSTTPLLKKAVNYGAVAIILADRASLTFGHKRLAYCGLAHFVPQQQLYEHPNDFLYETIGVGMTVAFARKNNQFKRKQKVQVPESEAAG